MALLAFIKQVNSQLIEHISQKKKKRQNKINNIHIYKFNSILPETIYNCFSFHVYCKQKKKKGKSASENA